MKKKLMMLCRGKRNVFVKKFREGVPELVVIKLLSERPVETS